MQLAYIFVIVIFSFVLIKAADLVIVAVRRLSRDSRASVFTISALILAVGTSFPELFVGLTAAMEGTPNISLGDVTGSNIANIALVGSITALIIGKVRVRGDYLRREVGVALVAALLPLIMLIDGELSKVNGLILISIYFAYATSFFRTRYEQIGRERHEESFVYRFFRQFNHINAAKKREMGKFFVGLALMIFCADMIVRSAVHLASLADIPTFVIGIVVVAIGTSLPEFAFSLRSLGEHEPQMFFGNLLGSTIANSTLILGVVSLISPIKLVAVDKYYIAAGVFIIIFITFWIFIRTKHRLDRWEAFVMLIMYVIFIISELV